MGSHSSAAARTGRYREQLHLTMARLKPTASIKHPLRINKENVWDRKKALKHCVRKLRHIEDPETQLHQAVLLNNTLQRIKTIYQPLQQNTITAETERRVFIVITTQSLIIIW